MGQSNKETVSAPKKDFVDVTTAPVLNMNRAVAKPVKQINKQGMAITIVPTGGTAANAYGLYNGGKTALWADVDLNAVAFVHRAETPGSGYLRYDLSKDGGATWTGNLGPIYSPDNITHFNARYPQGLIYNPTGNTNIDNAYFVSFAATLDATNGGSWGGIGYGTAKVDSTSVVFNSLTTVPPVYHNVPSGMTIRSNGKILCADASFPTGTFTFYNDTLNLYKGEFNTTSQEVEYTIDQIQFFTSPGDSLTTLEKEFPVDVKVAFNPTDPNVGYIGMVTHTSIALVPDEGYYPVVLKTTDGGATWSAPIPVPLKNFGDLISPNFITDTELSADFPGLTRADLWFRTSFELDMVVDGDGNPHLVVHVFPGDNGRGLGAFSVYGSSDPAGIFDIWSPDGGITWEAKLLSRTMTFRGTFGDISEDTRPQAATTADGTKVFFSWIDTDTILFGSANQNGNPDIWVMGFDPVNDLVTPVMNVTTGTSADGGAFMGTMSEFVFSNAGTYTLPLVYQDFPPSTPTVAATFYYVDGVEFTDADFTASTNDIERSVVSVSQNYPNPSNGRTTIDVNLTQSSKVVFTVHNIMGQVVYQKNYGVLSAGSHKIELNQELNTGIYTYTVEAGTSVVTRKMMVE